MWFSKKKPKPTKRRPMRYDGFYNFLVEIKQRGYQNTLPILVHLNCRGYGRPTKEDALVALDLMSKQAIEKGAFSYPDVGDVQWDDDGYGYCASGATFSGPKYKIHFTLGISPTAQFMFMHTPNRCDGAHSIHCGCYRRYESLSGDELYRLTEEDCNGRGGLICCRCGAVNKQDG